MSDMTSIELQMAAMAQGMKEMSSALQTIATNQAVYEERMLRVVEDNQRRDIRITNLEKKTSTMDRIAGLNTYARGIAPKIFYSLLGALTAGCTITLGILKIMDKI